MLHGMLAEHILPRFHRPDRRLRILRCSLYITGPITAACVDSFNSCGRGPSTWAKQFSCPEHRADILCGAKLAQAVVKRRVCRKVGLEHGLI